VSKKRKTKDKPGDFVDLEFDAVSGQYKQLVLERNGHPVWIQLWVMSHLSLLLFNCRFFCRFKSIQFSRVHRVAFYREHANLKSINIYISRVGATLPPSGSTSKETSLMPRCSERLFLIIQTNGPRSRPIYCGHEPVSVLFIYYRF